MSVASSDPFEDVIEFPDTRAHDRFERLVGLEKIKDRLVKESRIWLDPDALTAWSEEKYGRQIALLDLFRDRTPLFVFAGDVGTGKTALAESFGDRVAREANIPITLYRLSLNTRGRGAVGEMTQRIGAAFRAVADAAQKRMDADYTPRGGIILLIDEADALAQSRELDQMHHEDRAGVNALIQGIDHLARKRLPVLVVMCTNRLSAIDPAVRRRAAQVFEFARPNYHQRRAVLESGLRDIGFDPCQLEQLAQVTGEQPGRPYGYTYSDLIQRLLPAIVVDAFPSQPIRYERVLEIAASMMPTPPFQEHSGT